jgi:hypothetical protein
MLRRNQLISTAALALACSLPASAAVAQQDLRMPDNRGTAGGVDATETAAETGQDLRMPDNRGTAGGADVTETAAERGQDLRMPDAADAARDLPPVHIPAPVVEVREVPSPGFDWGDAGLGAAGAVALFSIAAGSTLLVTNRRRRRGLEVTAQ